MELRNYQRDAVNAVYNYLSSKDGNCCVVIPTGGGKTPVISQICYDFVKRWNSRVMILSHVKELLEQSDKTLYRFDSSLDVGIYSAGLGSHDTHNSIIIAGIQSIYNKAEIFGKIDLIIVDEAHLLPQTGEGRYRTFMTAIQKINPSIRIIGMTATPYRLGTGMLCGPDNILNEICYEKNVRELIDEGWLSHIRSRNGKHAMDFHSLRVQAGEFIASDVDAMMSDDSNVYASVSDILRNTDRRQSILIFASSVDHAEKIQKEIVKRTGDEVGLITGKTYTDQRAEILSRFRREQVACNLFGDVQQPLRWLVNMNVLTTGFDAPNVDCVVLLRPTMSPGLYVQMVGRGMRLYDRKKDCLVLDYGNNIKRHGCIDNIYVRKPSQKAGDAPIKVCPECGECVHLATKKCICGYEFDFCKKNSLTTRSDKSGVLTGEKHIEEYDVIDVMYHVHTKKNDTHAPKTLQVTYQCDLQKNISEWVCPEHDGWARKRFERWWHDRSIFPVPSTADEACNIARQNGLAKTLHIKIEIISGEKFPHIKKYIVGQKPEKLYSKDDWLADFLDS